MRFEMRENDGPKENADPELLEDVAQWLRQARAAGWTDAELVVERWWLGDQGNFLAFCHDCGTPTASLDIFEPTAVDVESRRAHLHGGIANTYVLCGQCETGDPGHDAFHADIGAEERERQYSYVPNLPRSERRRAHEAFSDSAKGKHRQCPWAERGYHCPFASNLDENGYEEEEDENEDGGDDD